MKGILSAKQNSNLLFSTQNMIVKKAGVMSLETFSGYNDRRATLVKFGDSDVETSYYLNVLEGQVLYEKSTGDISFPEWNKVVVEFQLSPTEVQFDGIKEIGLFSEDSKYMWSRAVLPRFVQSGSATVEFEWTFTFQGF